MEQPGGTRAGFTLRRNALGMGTAFCGGGFLPGERNRDCGEDCRAAEIAEQQINNR